MGAGATIVNFRDRLQDLISGLGGPRDRTTTQSFGGYVPISLTEIDAMYRTDWVSKKIVDIVPQDMIRAGRVWSATKEQIVKIQTLENGLRLWPKLKEALTRARLFGTCLLYMGVGDDDPSTPLDPESVKSGGLRYLTVLDRQVSSFAGIDTDPTSPNFGGPLMWYVGVQGSRLEIHPSRTVRFTGVPVLTQPVTSVGTVWGDSVLQAVYSAVLNAASVQQHIAGLVPDARNDVIYVPGLGKILQNPVEEALLKKRFSLMADMRSMYRVVLLEGSGRPGDTGENWQQRTTSFAQLPELMKQYLQLAAGAADIPITRFLDESPGGMNATGESDMRNYNNHVGALQTLQLSPAMHQLDEVLIRSALGSRPPEISFKWSELYVLNATEKSVIFNNKATAARSIVGSRSGELPFVDPRAVNEAFVGSATQDGTLPGLDVANDKFPLTAVLPTDVIQETLSPTPPPAPSAPPAGGSKKTSAPVADAQPRTLYVRRQLLNTSELVRWASDQGIVGIEPSESLHVTVMHSDEPIDWMTMGEDWAQGDRARVVVGAGGPRVVEPLGKATATLQFSSSSLAYRHESMKNRGAKSKFDDYIPHVTLSLAPQTTDLTKITPFRGELRFGPEIFEETNQDA